MVDIAGQTMGGFLTGRSMAMQEEERGYLAEERAKKSAREEAVAAKAKRIQGYLGDKQMAPQAREEAVFGEDPELGKQMRDFRTDQDAENADLNASDAAVVSQAIGTADEQSALLWFAGELEGRGAPQEQIAEVMQQYEQAPPEQRSQLASRVVQGFMARGMGAKDYLATRKPEDKRLPTSGMKNVIMPEGGQRSFDITDPKGRADYQEAINAGGTDAPTRQEAGGPGAFAVGSDAEMKKVREDIIVSEDNTRNLIGYVDGIQTIIRKTPTANALGGSLAKIGRNLIVDVKSAAKLVGGEPEEDANRILSDNVDGHREDLENMGIENARVQSAIIGLAYQAALQANQRVTDADFKAALKEIGASHSDPELFSAILDDYKDRAIDRYENTYTSRRNMYPTGKIGEMAKFDRNGKKSVEYTKKTKPNAEGVVMGLNPETNEWEVIE